MDEPLIALKHLTIGASIIKLKGHLKDQEKIKEGKRVKPRYS